LIEVRLARPEEYAAAGDVTVEAYRSDGLLDDDPEYANKLRDTVARAREAELIVAVDGESGAMLGTVTYCPPASPWSELGGEHDGEFRMLAVAPSARSRGIGRLLAQHCLDHASELGLSSVKICSRPAMHSAHRLYETLGFRRAPELDWFPRDGFALLGFERSLKAVRPARP
jgi:ribosomal protein S18 acetylase RimI-like enzyme